MVKRHKKAVEIQFIALMDTPIVFRREMYRIRVYKPKPYAQLGSARRIEANLISEIDQRLYEEGYIVLALAPYYIFIIDPATELSNIHCYYFYAAG